MPSSVIVMAASPVAMANFTVGLLDGGEQTVEISSPEVSAREVRRVDDVALG